MMEKALKTLLEKLEGVSFAALGTSNLFLQGIEIAPRDLDLLADDRGVDRISKIFGSAVTFEEEDRYKETKFKINGTEVHVVSNKNNPLRPKNFREQLVWVEKGDLKVPCLPLESELQFYQRAGRSKDRGKVELIQEALRRTQA